MRKKLLVILAAVVAFLFIGCAAGTPAAEQTDPFEIESPIILEPVQPQTEPTEPAPIETEPPETIPTEPEHSVYYIPNVSVEDVIVYFNEVVLDGEFINSGDPSFVQKWTTPIFYTLYGVYTNEDIETLSSFTSWLNTIDGFPGMLEAQIPEHANLRIHFCSQSDIVDLMGENFSFADGGVTFWYDHDEIYDAIICCRSDLDQYTRNSVILEEVYNGLGPVQDTTLRPDSLIYQEYSCPQSLTEVDELILRLLYHPQIRCGMNAEECGAVIRQLYY